MVIEGMQVSEHQSLSPAKTMPTAKTMPPSKSLPAALIDDMWTEFCRHRRALTRPDRQWKLTFDEYVDLWLPHWHLRRKFKLVMCRAGFAGDYEVGNVRVDTRENQLKDQWRAYRKRLGKPEYETGPQAEAMRRAAVAALHEKWREEREEVTALIGPYRRQGG